MRPISLAHLTAIALPPPALIRAAVEAGFDGVGLRLLRVTPESPGYPLMQDPAALRATRAALAETGIAVSDIEFIRITPEFDPKGYAAFLDTGAALGARHVITAPYDPDLARLADNLGAFTGEAAARGLGTVLEFFPWTPVPDLATCRSVVEQAAPRTGILVDSLHFDRSRSALADLAAIPPDRLSFAHIADAPVQAGYSTEELLRTAREDRLPPGAGGIDLTAILSALPENLPLSVEIPLAGDPAPSLEDLRALLAATLWLLDRLEGGLDEGVDGHGASPGRPVLTSTGIGKPGRRAN